MRLEKLPPWKRKKSGAKKSTPLTTRQIEQARERAKAAGRRYPNLVDNLWAARHAPKTATALRDGAGIIETVERGLSSSGK